MRKKKIQERVRKEMRDRNKSSKLRPSAGLYLISKDVHKLSEVKYINTENACVMLSYFGTYVHTLA